MRVPSLVRTAPTFALAVLTAAAVLPAAGDAQEPDPATGAGDALEASWALSLEIAPPSTGLYGAWRRVLPALDLGVELGTALSERTVEVDRVDRPGRVNASTDVNRFELTVGPSLRWRVRPEADLSPVVRVHGGYARVEARLEEGDGDVFDRTADGLHARASVGVEYRVAPLVDLALSLGGRWSSVEGDVQFHVKETSRTTELTLLVPAATVVIRF